MIAQGRALNPRAATGSEQATSRRDAERFAEPGRRLCVAVAILAFAAGCERSGAPNETPSLRPPPTRTESADTTYFGIRVSDPYRWLEHGDSADVKQWIDTENAYTDSVTSKFADAAVMAKRVEELSTTSPDRLSPVIAGHTLYYLRETPPAPQPVLVASNWPSSGKERVLVDVNAAGGGTTIAAYWPSPSGRFVAYGTAEGGSELTTIRFIDANTGIALPDSLPFACGGTSPQALAWDGDEKGVTFARYPLPDSTGKVSEFDAALYHHRFGVPGDSAVFGVGYSRIAEYRLFTAADGKQAAALVNKGDGGPASVYLRTADASGVTWKLAMDSSFGVTTAAYDGTRLLVVATSGAPRGRVMGVSPDGVTSDVLPEQEWAVQSVAPIGTGILVLRVNGPRWRVDHYAANGQLVRTLGIPSDGVGITDIASSPTNEQALIAWSGWTTPTQWQRYDGRAGGLTTLFQVKPAADYSRVVAHVIAATSKDGTSVPVTVLAMQGTPQDGTAPAILYGYGGFGIPVAPGFIGPYLSWLERGGVLAYANIRGGDEFGEGWHQAGMKTRKQNVFDDFYAASQALVQQRWTSTDRLGIRGASNGGLLMGAELTQHPAAFRAVVSFVGIYDMVRHQTFPNGAYNVSEYGSTADSAEFAALDAYSPLHHVQKGVAYPAVLMETGVNDPRVAPWQSRKFTAALQSATSSGRPVVLVTRQGAGHGIGAPFAQRVGNTALALSFMARELGLPNEPIPPTDAPKSIEVGKKPATKKRMNE